MKKLDVIGMMAENKPFDTQSNTALSPHFHGHAVAGACQPTSLLRPEAGSDEWGSSSPEGVPLPPGTHRPLFLSQLHQPLYKSGFNARTINALNTVKLLCRAFFQ